MKVDLQNNSDVNETDDLGNTPLHHDVHHRNHAASLELMKNNAFIGAKNKLHESPLNEMKFEVLEEALDDRVTLIEASNGEDKTKMKISIDFNLLLGEKSKSEVEALEIIAKNSILRSLFIHPVISAFIYQKLNKLSWILYSNFVIFMPFLFALIVYHVVCQITIFQNSAVLMSFKVISIFGIFLLFIRESMFLLACFFFNSWINYFKSLLNLIHLTLIFLAIFSLTFENKTELHIATAFFAALAILNLMNELPFLWISCHLYTLQKVAIGFLKSLISYFIKFVALTLSVWIIIKINQFNIFPGSNDNNSTANDGQKLLILPMPFTDASNDSNDEPVALVRQEVFFSLMLLMFIFTATIAIFNITTALSAKENDDNEESKREREIFVIWKFIKVLKRYEKMFYGFEKYGIIKDWLNYKINNGIVFIQPYKSYLVTEEEVEKETSENGWFIRSIKRMRNICEIHNKLNKKTGHQLKDIIERKKEK